MLWMSRKQSDNMGHEGLGVWYLHAQHRYVAGVMTERVTLG